MVFMASDKKKSILIIDDEKDVVDSVSGFLKRNGYDVFGASTGQEGLKIAREELPSLIILDLMLPDIDGSDVAAQLLNNLTTKEIPIIFLTAIVTKSEQEATGEFIANRCIIAKPCSSEEILSLVKNYIGLPTP